MSNEWRVGSRQSASVGAHSRASSLTSVLVTDVTQQFGAIPALSDLNLAVRAGEFVCLVGPSGCGKTSLLRILAGLARPTSGTVRLAGRVATVFQGQSLFPWRTAVDNVAYGLQLEGMPTARRREIAMEQLRRVGLERFARAYPHTLSGGMQQRVNIARALAIGPDVLLMDEPFGSLDEQTRIQMQEQLVELWQGSGTTVLFVTHSVDEAVAMGDRVCVMSARPGRIILDLPIDLSRPRTRYADREGLAFRAAATRIWEVLERGRGEGLRTED
ncbi:MAG: ABC transporter ATP-binding protein [Chloroflexota bacterium]|nr:ABC transporter ATP-binding protein [Chloroflexota bacterium]